MINFNRILLKEIFFIIFISVLTSLVYNHFSPKGISLIRTEKTKIMITDAELFKPPGPFYESKRIHEVLRIITIEQMKRLIDEKRGILIDARNRDEFQFGHIPGARNIPFLDFEQYIEELVDMPRDTLIIIYCNNNDCPLGESLAGVMQQMGFMNILLYENGWDEWVKNQLPIELPNERKQE